MTRLALALLALALVAASGCATPPTAPSSSSGSSPAAALVAAPAAPLELTVTAPASTRNETVTLHGTLGRAAHLSVGNASLDAAAGAWTMPVPVKFGETTLLVQADDGVMSSNATVLAVRLASATMQVVFTQAVPAHASYDDLVWYDPDGFASASMYTGTSAHHPPNANVHDLMVAWTAQTNHPIEYGGPGSFGFSVNKIDGVGQPLTAEAPPYWCYTLNGDNGVLGITDQALKPGDVVHWDFSTCVV